MRKLVRDGRHVKMAEIQKVQKTKKFRAFPKHLFHVFGGPFSRRLLEFFCYAKEFHEGSARLACARPEPLQGGRVPSVRSQSLRMQARILYLT